MNDRPRQRSRIAQKRLRKIFKKFNTNKKEVYNKLQRVAENFFVIINDIFE